MITIGLYVIVPKGFLPLQDTGLVQAVHGGGARGLLHGDGASCRTRSPTPSAPTPTSPAWCRSSASARSTPRPTPATSRSRSSRATQRKANVTAIIDRLKEKVGAIPGITVYFQPVQDVQISTRISRAQYQYTLVGSDEKDVATWSARLAEQLRSSPVLREVVSEAQDGGLRAMVQVDRETAGRLGVSMQAINDALNDAFGQRQISTIYAQANQYRVVLEAAPQYQSDPAALSRIYVPGHRRRAGAAERGGAASSAARAPLAISHQEQFPSVTISFNLAPGAALERRGVGDRGGEPARSACRPRSRAATRATPTSSPSRCRASPG